VEDTNAMTVATAQDHYLARFDRFRDRRATEPSWLGKAREAAIARFASLGFPTPRHEEWRFTNVAPIASTPFEDAQPAAGVTADRLAPFTIDGVSGPRLVFVNGRFSPALSSTGTAAEGVHITSLASILASAVR
jgi:Fe-S cluster assembly protein SufD